MKLYYFGLVLLPDVTGCNAVGSCIPPHPTDNFSFLNRMSCMNQL